MTNDSNRRKNTKTNNTESPTVFSLGFSSLFELSIEYLISDAMCFWLVGPVKHVFPLAKGSWRNNFLNTLNAVTWSISVPSLSVQFKWLVNIQLGKRNDLYHPSSPQMNSSYSQSKRNKKGCFIILFWSSGPAVKEVSTLPAATNRVKHGWKHLAGHLLIFFCISQRIATGNFRFAGLISLDPSQM